MMAPIAELLGMRRGGERWERFAHQISSTVEKLFAWGATFAAFALVAIWGLYPRLWGYLTSLFMIQVIIIAGLLWFSLTATAYIYYLTWESLRNHRIVHNLIGWTFVLSTMLFINTIIVFDTHMLTPEGGVNALLAAAINPSYVGEFPHRHIGNLSYGGLLLAAYVGGWFLLFRGRHRFSRAEMAYHDWLGDVALLVGLSVLLLQPVAGWFYANQIRIGSYGAYYRMMIGDNAWLFRLQMGLLGTVFFLGNLYLFFGIRRGDPGPRTLTWIKYSLLATAILLGLGLLPPSVPLGQMNPWKYISLAGFMALTAVNLVLYLRARPRFEWGSSDWRSNATLATIAVVIVSLFVVMGIIRSSARQPWLIYDQMGPNQSQEILRP